MTSPILLSQVIDIAETGSLSSEANNCNVRGSSLDRSNYGGSLGLISSFSAFSPYGFGSDSIISRDVRQVY